MFTLKKKILIFSTYTRWGSDFNSGPCITLNWFWRGCWHQFQQISSVRLQIHLLSAFHNFSLHILCYVPFHYSMSPSIAGSKFWRASAGLFPNPISQKHSIKSKRIFLAHEYSLFMYSIPMCLAIFTCSCLSILNSLSVNLGNREHFPFQMNSRMEAIHRTLGPNDKSRVRYLFGCCKSLTFSFKGHFKNWLSQCFVIEIMAVSNDALFFLNCVL